MDTDPPSRPPRKVRFAPKGPPRRKAKPTAPKAEKVDDNQDEEAEHADLLRRATEHLAGRGPKIEKKSSVQVAFAHGAATSSSIRTFGKPREGNGGGKSIGSTDSACDNREIVICSSPSTATTEGTDGSSVNAVVASPQKMKKDYIVPYDYEHTYYPNTLPMRRPYSGDPELLDAAEFGEASEKMEYNENTINAAEELSLLEENEEEQMIFLQLPTCGNRVDGKNMSGSQLPQGGHVGKMLVYKSGAVKWKIGEALYDVSPGSNPKCPQDVVAINTVDKDCCMLGELGQRAVVTPEIDFLLDGGMNLK